MLIMSTEEISTLNSTLSTSTISIPTFTIVDVNIAQVIASVAVIITIMLEKIENHHMKRFILVVLTALCLETILIGLYALIPRDTLYIDRSIFVWQLYKIVRLFVSLSLCYPILVFTNSTAKVHAVFLFISIVIISGAIANLTKPRSGFFSGYNNVAFMCIFLFTLYQYYQLKSQLYNDNNRDYIKGLKSLMAIEIILIALNALLIILFYSGFYNFLQALRLALTMIQYLKIYMIMSMFASLKISIEPSHHL